MFIGYLIVTDNSISYAFALVLNLIKFQYEKQKWWLLNNPRNIIVRWVIDRNSMKMAEELMKEFAEKEKK
jgi:hypothetical protein